MKRKMKPATFALPKQMLRWLRAEHEKTGLTQVEIVRRALDDYRSAQEVREKLQMFTAAQKKDIKIIAQIQSISEVEVIRAAVDRERQRVTAELNSVNKQASSNDEGSPDG